MQRNNDNNNRTNARITTALAGASDTQAVQLGDGVMTQTAAVFEHCFGQQTAMVVADTHTFAAAGRQVVDILRTAGVTSVEPFVFDDPHLHAYYQHVETLQRILARTQALPIAVGSGTVNDLTKLAAHLCGRPYMVVATAASMDGYTAYGASINKDGSKQTFFCPAPRAVVADMAVIGAAPAELNAAGYGDLLAKNTAGADWILADTLGIEPINPPAWSLVQDCLRDWTANPNGIRQGDRQALQNLTEGLLMTGFAMQQCRSSRPASGAEHQFSHLWDMQDHHYQGRIPLHGCKVAIGTLASARLYEQLLDRGPADWDADAICKSWPSFAEIGERITQMHPQADLRTVAMVESQAKYLDGEALRKRLMRLRQEWPTLKNRLREQLISPSDLEQMLQQTGTPTCPTQIGITHKRLRHSYLQAQQIRRRYTVLDLANESGQMDDCLEKLFGVNGAWRNAHSDEAS